MTNKKPKNEYICSSCKDLNIEPTVVVDENGIAIMYCHICGKATNMDMSYDRWLWRIGQSLMPPNEPNEADGLIDPGCWLGQISRVTD